MSHLRDNVSTLTGTATGVTAGAVVSGNKVFMGGTSMKTSDLSALVSCTANTSGLTMKPQWQVSADGTTWYNFQANATNPSVVALATGASGGGNVASGNLVIPAPDAIKGWKFARFSLAIGVATGTTSDTFSIGYSYRQFSQGEIAR